MKRNKSLLLIALLLITTSIAVMASPETITNGVTWRDTSSNILHAHGGGFIKVGSYYYWFGENRNNDGDLSFKSVRCYRSTNLKDWEFRGDVLTENSDPDLSFAKIERPKVIYCAATGKYVMWMHKEYGSHYGEARAAVATCSTVDGNYSYQGSFQPLGYMSRDCTTFVDDNGSAYFISAANENYDLHVYRLTSDYESINYLVQILWAGGHREAPAMFKRNGYYFLVTSGCTGWDPNQGKYAYATSIAGTWSSLQNFGNSNNYDSQPTYVIPVSGSQTTSYLYCGDRWMDPGWFDSKYIWLPITFNSSTSISLPYYPDVTIDTATGEITGGGLTYYKIIAKHSGKSLEVAGQSTENGADIQQYDYWGGNSQKWQLVDAGSGYYYIVNKNSNKEANVDGGSTSNGANIQQWGGTWDENKWRLDSAGSGYYYIVNKKSGKVMDVYGQSTANGASVQQYSNWGGDNQKWQLIAVD